MLNFLIAFRLDLYSPDYFLFVDNANPIRGCKNIRKQKIYGIPECKADAARPVHT
jgi:hypothetical protein